jgi:hypothetical protein
MQFVAANMGEALTHYDPTLQPGLRLHDLAKRLVLSGEHESAIVAAIGACELEPDRFEPWAMLAAAYDGIKAKGAERFQEAAARRGLELNPKDPITHYNLSLALGRIYQWDEALTEVNIAHQLDSSNPHYLLQASFLMGMMKNSEMAIKLLTGAINLFIGHGLDKDPENARFFNQVYCVRAMHKRDMGDLQGHFDDMYRRHEYCTDEARAERYAEGTQWRDGQPVGRSVVIELENGLGDEIHYSRLIPPFIAANPQIESLIVRCNPILKPLLPDYGFCKSIYARPTDTHIAVMELAEWAYHNDLPVFGKWTGPYLNRPKAKLCRTIPGKIAIGFCWAGNPKMPYDWARSFSIEHFLTWAEQYRNTCTFHSMQYGPDRYPFPDWVEDCAHKDLWDTAGTMMAMNAFVGPDTGLVHVAGGLGIPCVLMHTYTPDQRWTIDGPVYDPETFRFAQQPTPGDWGGAFKLLQAELDAAIDTAAKREFTQVMAMGRAS